MKIGLVFANVNFSTQAITIWTFDIFLSEFFCFPSWLLRVWDLSFTFTYFTWDPGHTWPSQRFVWFLLFWTYWFCSRGSEHIIKGFFCRTRSGLWINYACAFNSLVMALFRLISCKECNYKTGDKCWLYGRMTLGQQLKKTGEGLWELSPMVDDGLTTSLSLNHHTRSWTLAFCWQISRIADYLNAIEQKLIFTQPIQKVLIGRIDYLIQHRLAISW